MKTILLSVAKFCLLLALGLGLGYGAVSLWQWHGRADATKQFMASNVHAGDYAAIVPRVGHGEPVMVVLKGCHFCALARVWLASHHVRVVEVPIGSQPDIAIAMRRWDDNATPTLITTNALTIGFDADAWNAILKP